jgi:hypothetical protein
MSNYEKYFQKDAYKPTYHLGDRVFGHHNGIPYIGYVYNDSRVYVDSEPSITVHLYLPIKIDGKFVSVISTTHDKVKSLVDIDEIGKKKKNVRTTLVN